MDERNERYWDLMAMYLKNEISEQQKTELLEWVEQDPANKEVFYRSTHLWQLTGKASDAFQADVTQAWKRFQATIDPAKESEYTSPSQSTGRVLPMWWLRVAAAAVILIGAGIGYWLLRSPAVQPLELVTLQTIDRKQDFYLPDGSHVFLNRNSKLVYDKAFDGEKRFVHLNGEAFFEVKPNPRRVFVIYTSYTQIEVLGTSFSVREEEDKQKTEVSVVTGKVAFYGRNSIDTSRLYLKPGLTGVYNYTGNLSVHTTENPNFIAWKAERLVFTNTRMSSVISTIETYFGIKIDVKSPQILDCHFTGTFEKPALDDVLHVLALSTNLNVEKQSGQYVFSGQGCDKK